MCGRYVLRSPLQHVLELFGATPEAQLPLFPPRYNIAPSQDVVVIRLNKNGNRALGLVRWGLIPHWAKGAPKVQPINARAETLTTSGLFRQAFASRRCLIPTDGFYEWKKLEGKTKQPMFNHFADDHPFALAGVWERWKPASDAEPVDTCTIITTAANKLMSSIHNRMPAILSPADYDRWLDKATDLAKAQKLLQAHPVDDLEATPVDRLVNSPKSDVPECVRPLE
jgi:putative SOS response-associated peptidase YedK